MEYLEYTAVYFIKEKIEGIWNSYKPKDRKIYLESIGLDINIAKKKFINLMEGKWISYSKDNDNWKDFLNLFKKWRCSLYLIL